MPSIAATNVLNYSSVCIDRRITNAALSSSSISFYVCISLFPTRKWSSFTYLRHPTPARIFTDAAHPRRRVAAASSTDSGSTAQANKKISPVQFNDGSSTKFAPLLNGCWTLAGGHGRIVEQEILRVMDNYASQGLTTFDTADIYGPSEQILGTFNEQWRQKKRQRMEADLPDVQIFTKYVPNIFQGRLSPSSVENSIRKSMKALRVERLDLVQLHWWDYNVPGMLDAALALTELREKGLIASIGTTNMNTEYLSKIVDAGVPVVCNQVQFSVLDPRPLDQMVPFCRQRDIKLLTYGSLAGGLLSDKYRDGGKQGMVAKLNLSNRVDLSTSSLKMYWNIVKVAGGEVYWRKLLEVLAEIAAKHSSSASNVALKWVMQQGPAHPIIGIRNDKHLEENLKVFELSLDESDLLKIGEVQRESKGPVGDCYDMERLR